MPNFEVPYDWREWESRLSLALRSRLESKSKLCGSEYSSQITEFDTDYSDDLILEYFEEHGFDYRIDDISKFPLGRLFCFKLSKYNATELIVYVKFAFDLKALHLTESKCVFNPTINSEFLEKTKLKLESIFALDADGGNSHVKVEYVICGCFDAFSDHVTEIVASAKSTKSKLCIRPSTYWKEALHWVSPKTDDEIYSEVMISSKEDLLGVVRVEDLFDITGISSSYVKEVVLRRSGLTLSKVSECEYLVDSSMPNELCDNNIQLKMLFDQRKNLIQKIILAKNTNLLKSEHEKDELLGLIRELETDLDYNKSSIQAQLNNRNWALSKIHAEQLIKILPYFSEQETNETKAKLDLLILNRKSVSIATANLNRSINSFE